MARLLGNRTTSASNSSLNVITLSGRRPQGKFRKNAAQQRVSWFLIFFNLPYAAF
jgi:hypothetical protein